MKKILLISFILLISVTCYGQNPSKAETVSFLSNRLQGFFTHDQQNPSGIPATIKVTESDCKLTIDKVMSIGITQRAVLDMSKFKDIILEDKRDYFKTTLYFNYRGVEEISFMNGKKDEYNCYLTSYELTSLDKELTNRVIKAFKHLSTLCGSTPMDDNLFK